MSWTSQAWCGCTFNVPAAMVAVVLPLLAASADTFDEYASSETFALPAGTAVFDALPDGRLAALVGDQVYLESGPRTRQFDLLGTLSDAVIPEFGAAFLACAPEGARLAVGNNGFGAGAAVGIFEPSAAAGQIAVQWVAMEHFDGAWYDNDTLAVTGGFDPATVTLLDLSDSADPLQIVVVGSIGGAAAGVAFDGQGNLYTGNGFQTSGPSGSGWIKAFEWAEWIRAATSGVPLDFETAGAQVADLLSAAALGFDQEGNLHVGGGDLFGGSGDFDRAAVVRAAAVQQALAGGGAVDPGDPQQVLFLDPDVQNQANFYDITANPLTCELLIREGAMAYVYVGTDPYAHEVVSYLPGSGVGVDFISGEPFQNPLTALGRPTVDTTGDGVILPVNQAVPVNAVYAPLRAAELVGVGSGGHLVIKFNHPVLDDPCNPYGIDLIAYGNAFYLAAGGPWQNGDPQATLLSGVLFGEPGVLSVSQDGRTWYAFERGPFADGFAPTLGRRFDPESPDAGLGPWNLWWGQPTDPTVPLDPELQPADLSGLTVAQAAATYGVSAGGTGFDIGTLGLDWVQYVRVQPGDFAVPEIDALADVAPLGQVPSDPDLDGDGVVGPADLAILLGQWGPCDCCLADLNGDGGVGAADLAALLGSWH